MLDNILQSFLPTGRARLPQPQSSQRQINVIANHDHIAWHNLEETTELLDALSAEVHVGLRCYQQDFFISQHELRVQCLEFQFIDGCCKAPGQFGQNVESDIMSCSDILPTGISEPNNQFHAAFPGVMNFSAGRRACPGLLLTLALVPSLVVTFFSRLLANDFRTGW